MNRKLTLFLAMPLLMLPVLGQEISQGEEIPKVLPKPAPAMPSKTSQPTFVFRNGIMSHQVNVNGNGENIVGDAANEPSLAIDPTNQDRIVIGWRQFGNRNSSFRQAGWAYSHNAGKSWNFPGSIDATSFRSDPVLASDADGNFYYNSLFVNGNNFSCTVFRSFDGGVTWDQGTFAQGGDKQWMCIDQGDGTGRGNVYAAWNTSFSVCNGDFTASYDGGNTYISCLALPMSPRWGTIAVGPDGEVYISGVLFSGIGVVKSSTIQNALATPEFDFANTVNLGGFVSSSTGPNPVGLLGQVYVATDTSTGPNRGNVYMLASVSGSQTDILDVMFSRSEDGGETWSSPVRVNDDQAGNDAWQWFGMMDVAPNGRIDVFWNDTRNNLGTFISELYYAYSNDGGRTWSSNVAVSPSFDPHLGWPQQQKIGDYNDLESGPDGVDVAYSATFNGEQDVYHLRINPGQCDADLNGDLKIDGDDVLVAAESWSSGGTIGDLNTSGTVDALDLVLIVNLEGDCPL